MGLGVPEAQQREGERGGGLLNGGEEELRVDSLQFRRTIQDDVGWVPAIQFLADGVSKRANIPIRIDAIFSGRLAGPIETALYRIVQEALNNAVKHAAAKNIWVRARKEHHGLCCSIRDDGVGFDPHQVQTASHRNGLGLVAMQERVSAIGGTLQIESRPGHGTELSIRLPLEDSHANSNRTCR